MRYLIVKEPLKGFRFLWFGINPFTHLHKGFKMHTQNQRFSEKIFKKFFLFSKNALKRRKSRLLRLRNRRLQSLPNYLIITVFFFALMSLQRTSSTASVYLPCSIRSFFSDMSDCITRLLSSSFI